MSVRLLSAHFDGATYEAKHDRARLHKQRERIRDLMSDGRWRSVSEIAEITHDPEPSVSAQLRNLRKERMGGFVVDRRKRGDRARGLYEFRLLPPDPGAVKNYGNDAKQVAQQLRDELRLLRSAALEAAGLMDEFELVGTEGERWEMAIRVLRERSAGLVRP